MQVGSAWTKTEEKEGKKVVTGISITVDTTNGLVPPPNDDDDGGNESINNNSNEGSLD